MKVPYENLKKANEPFFIELTSKFQEVLESGWYILGNQVSSFEAEFATYHNIDYCIGVASGLDALTLSLLACDFPKNSEVIVPSNTYIATILAIHQAGLKPVLVEPQIDSYNINPDLIESKISRNTVGIMVVHLYGKMCEMEAIMNIAKEYGLKVFEDCAQAHGANINGKKAGTWGDFGCFSFYPTKNLGALGDGGAIICKDEGFANKLKALRNYGSHKKYHNDFVGMNSRLDEVQAAFLRVKLQRLDDITKHKQNLAKLYFKHINHNSAILPIKQEGHEDVFHIFNIRHTQRDDLKNYLLKQGIGTEIHYPISPEKQNAMQGILTGHYPISNEIHNTTLSLPISFAHNEEEVIFVSECINNFRG